MCNDLSQLSKVKTHSVEYDLVMKAMKLAIWHLDVQTRTVQLESDHRDSNDSLVLPPQATVDDIFL